MKALLLTEKERRFLRGWCLELAQCAEKDETGKEAHAEEGKLFRRLAKKLGKKELARQSKLLLALLPWMFL